MTTSARSSRHAMLGSCEAFRRFASRLGEVAPADVTVLFEGESGTGKNLAARVLHQLSPRARGPLVEVQLAALAPTLVEAELFGHEAGAFTGARAARRGRFELASGGTLVLDGVETLPLPVQAKLLRVLQERMVEPLGAEAPRAVDVRVVATSSLGLAGLVREGRFREDLYYRLAVVVLELPPLRARREDLPELAAGLLARAAKAHGLAVRALSPEALERLAAHPWPGNVRELENALERALVLGRGREGPIEAAELDFLGEAVDGAAERLAREALANGIGLEALERALLEAALREERGNVAAAARRLALTRRAFEYRLGR